MHATAVIILIIINILYYFKILYLHVAAVDVCRHVGPGLECIARAQLLILRMLHVAVHAYVYA
jgi:hypothetical protein